MKSEEIIVTRAEISFENSNVKSFYQSVVGEVSHKMPFCDTFKTMRINAGLSRKQVADQADISEDSIRNIERHQSCKDTTIAAAIRAMNELYYDQRDETLTATKLITDVSKFN